MANDDIITHDKLVEPGAISDYLGKELKDLVSYLPTVEAAIDKAFKGLGDVARGFKVDSATIKDINSLNQAYKESIQLETAHTKVQETKRALTEAEIAQSQIDKANKRDRINLLKAEILEMDKSVGTLQRLEAANARLTLQRKALKDTDVDYQANLKKINAELDKNNAYIKANSDQLKQQRLNVGNYTDSIKAAFEGTGILGETIKKYLGIITLLSEKIEGVVSAVTRKKEADVEASAATEAQTIAEATNADAKIKSALVTEAEGTATVEMAAAEKIATVATSENTVAEEKNIVVTEDAIVAEKANKIALEGETVATEAATVATAGLGKALKALATNPYVIAAVAIAALAKVAYDNVTATQKQKDAWDAGEEGLKAYAKAALVAGVDAKQLAIDIAALTELEFKRQDLAISALTEKAKLRAEAAEARSQAMEEGKTVKDRIVLLQEFVDKTRQANQKEREELEMDVRIKSDIVKANGILATREQRKQEQEAIAALSANKKQTADETRKANKQIATLSEKYYDDLRKMRQSADKEEVEAIDTQSDLLERNIVKNLRKKKKLNDLETQQAVENLLDQQKKLGAIDAKGVDHTAEFEREVEDLRKSGRAKNKEEEIKAKNELLKIKQDALKEYLKLIEDYNKTLRELTSANAKVEVEISGNKVEAENIRYKDELTKLEDKYQNLLGKTDEYNKAVELLEKKHRYNLMDIQINADKRRTGIDDIATFIKNLDANGHTIDKVRREELKKQEKFEDELTKGLQEGLQKRSDIQQAYDQLKIDAATRNIDVQAKLAAEGKKNSLADQEALADKAEEKKIQDQKRQQRLQENIALITTFSKTLQSELDKGTPFIEAFGKATAAEGVVATMFSKLISGSYFEGTEDTGTVTNPLDSKGGRIAVLHNNEGVVNAAGKAEVPGLVTAINKDGLQGATDWAFKNIYLPQFNAANTTAVKSETVITTSYDPQLIHEIRKLGEEISKKPVQTVQIKGLKEVIEIVQQGSSIKRVRHIAQRWQ